MRITALALLIGLLFAQSIVAQDCSAIFRYGLYDIESSPRSLAQAYSFANWFCSNHTLSVADSFGGIYSDFVRGILSGNHASQEVHDLCTSAKGTQSLALMFGNLSPEINTQMVDTYKACINRAGFHAHLETTADPNVDRLVLSLQPTSDNDTHVKISKMRVQGANCHEPLTDVNPSGADRICTRIKNDPAIIIHLVSDHVLVDGTGDLSLPWPTTTIVYGSSARYEVRERFHMSTSTSPDGYAVSLAPTGNAKPAADARAFFTAPGPGEYHVTIVTRGTECPSCNRVEVVLYKSVSLTHDDVAHGRGVLKKSRNDDKKEPNFDYDDNVEMNKGESLWLAVNPCGELHCSGPVDVTLTSAVATVLW